VQITSWLLALVAAFLPRGAPDGKSFGVPLKVLPALGDTNRQSLNLPCTFERNGDKMARIAAALKVQAGKREWLWLSR
jgi:hypothetical protein